MGNLCSGGSRGPAVKYSVSGEVQQADVQLDKELKGVSAAPDAVLADEAQKAVSAAAEVAVAVPEPKDAEEEKPLEATKPLTPPTVIPQPVTSGRGDVLGLQQCEWEEVRSSVTSQPEEPVAVTPDKTIVAKAADTSESGTNSERDSPAPGCAALGRAYQPWICGPPKPACDEGRINTVRSLGPLDAPPDPEIDSILKLICNIFQTPNALVALFDDTRIFIRNATGAFQRGDFAWRWSFCGWSMAPQTDQIMVVPNALEDSRFCQNQFVKSEPGVRFYCGTPLIASNGHRLGTLCFADFKPRKFDAGQAMILNNLSEVVVRQIEKDIALQLERHDNKQLQEVYDRLRRAMDSFGKCVLFVDTSQPGWKVLYVNLAWHQLTGVERGMVMGRGLWDWFVTLTGADVDYASLDKYATEQREFVVDKLHIRDGESKLLVLKFRPASKTPIDEGAIPIGVPPLVSVNGCSSQPYYFVTLEEAESATRTGSVVSSQRSSMPYSSGYSMIQAEAAEIEGLEMSHLLGKGGYGSVYKGTWFGTPVAVKIVDNRYIKGKNAAGVSLEAVLGQGMRHPHIVRTMKYYVKKPNNNSWSHLNGMYSDFGGEFNMDVGKRLKTDSTVTDDTAKQTVISDDTAQQPEEEIKSASDNAGAWAVMDLDDAAIQVSPGGTPGPDFQYSPNEAAARSSSSSNIEGETWLVLEFCDRGCLQDAIDRGWLKTPKGAWDGEPNLGAILVTALEIASAMLYLHGLEIIHGDLSAFNVMLSTSSADAGVASRDFSAKVADFGLARNLDVQAKIKTRSYGTLTHMPPETLLHGTLSKAADVYAFGVLLWQMYTGSRPWVGLSHAQIIYKVGSGGARLEFPDGTPEGYAVLATSCMEGDPAARPSFEEICEMLEPLTAGL